MSTKDQWEMICPACASDESLAVEVKIFAALSEVGTEIHGGDQEWDDASKCECCGCGWSGLVKDAKRAFTVADAPEFECDLAITEGWGIFQTGQRWEIERDDEQDVFASDDDAETHVKAQATLGSQYHQDALNWLKLANEEE